MYDRGRSRHPAANASLSFNERSQDRRQHERERERDRQPWPRRQQYQQRPGRSQHASVAPVAARWPGPVPPVVAAAAPPSLPPTDCPLVDMESLPMIPLRLPENAVVGYYNDEREFIPMTKNLYKDVNTSLACSQVAMRLLYDQASHGPATLTRWNTHPIEPRQGVRWVKVKRDGNWIIQHDRVVAAFSWQLHSIELFWVPQSIVFPSLSSSTTTTTTTTSMPEYHPVIRVHLASETMEASPQTVRWHPWNRWPCKSDLLLQQTVLIALGLEEPPTDPNVAYQAIFEI